MLDPKLEAAVAALHQRQGQAALRLMRGHLATMPYDGQALHLLGVACNELGAKSDAIDWLSRCIAVLPASPLPLAALAGVLIDREEMQAASCALRRAVSLAPAVDVYLLSIAAALAKTMPAAEAPWLRRALAIDMRSGVAHGNLGICLRREERLDEAGAESRKALAFLPAQPESLNNLAILAIRDGRLEAADVWSTRAVATRPGFAEATWNRAIARMLAGRFLEAWDDWETRFEVPGAQKHRHPAARRWRGEDPAGKTVLLFAEQGLGDTIQFSRYAPLVAARGARTVLAVQARLVRLLKTLPGVADVVAADGNEPGHDWNCPLMSLPARFGTTLGSVPAAVPYLAPQDTGRLAWKRRLDAGRALRVGLCWQGNPANADDRRRSFPLDVFEGLREIRDVQFVAMRVTDEPIPSGWPMLDAAPWQHDMADTADLLAELDLLITCDTAVAHLAGALGRPVWTMLAHAADWRWLQKREDTPWYPTMRLFRQPRAGDWTSVAEEVKQALAARTTRFAHS